MAVIRMEVEMRPRLNLAEVHGSRTHPRPRNGRATVLKTAKPTGTLAPPVRGDEVEYSKAPLRNCQTLIVLEASADWAPQHTQLNE